MNRSFSPLTSIMLKMLVFTSCFVAIDIFSRLAMALSNFSVITVAWKYSGITLGQIALDVAVAVASYTVLWLGAKYAKTVNQRLVPPALVASVLLAALWFGEMISHMFWGYAALTFAAFFCSTYLVLFFWTKVSVKSDS